MIFIYNIGISVEFGLLVQKDKICKTGIILPHSRTQNPQVPRTHQSQP